MNVPTKKTLVALTVLTCAAAVGALATLGGTADRPGDGGAEQVVAGDRFGLDLEPDRTGRVEEGPAGQVAEDGVPLEVDLHRQVARTVVPADGTVETLVTPVEPGWWTLVTGLAADLSLNVPAPIEGQWFAYSSGRNLGPDADLVPFWAAVHVGFASTRDAAAFVDTLNSSPDGPDRYAEQRGKVVTVVPSAVDPTAQGFTPDPPEVRAGRHDRGAWMVDWSAKAHAMSAAHPDAVAYQALWSHLGFDPAGSLWSATADDPRGPWVGHVAGWDAEQVSVQAAGAALAGSAENDCETVTSDDGVATQMCVEVDEGLVDLLRTGRFADRHDTLGAAPVMVTADEDAVVAATFDTDAWLGLLATGGLHRSGLGSLGFSVDADAVMTVSATLESDRNQDEE